ncbi:MAG: sterol desaturase family protein [Verrucomicrobiales bacterium]
MDWLLYIPLLAFLLLLGGEAWLGRRQPNRHGPWDWAIHLSGFAFQGAVIPACGYLLASRALPAALPDFANVVPLGWVGAFLLNFVFVDFLFYWQHRLFHRSPGLWKLHCCHHTAARVDVWVTSRNSLLTHFLFVYLLVNPLLGYLVDRPDAFFAGAALTASLDLFRHASLDYGRVPGAARLAAILGQVFVLPSAHHRHHGSSESEVAGNFGANLIVWDRLFGTRLPGGGYPDAYGVKDSPDPLSQLIYPLKAPAGASHPAAAKHAPEP